ncbi:MAG: TadE/TadG family type IV pilus assembly protein [Xanthobacteraceae bacterium]
MIHLAMKSLRELKRQLAAFSGNIGGLAAVEFAMILPLMLVTVFGTVGVTAVIAIDRRVTLVARTLSDLTSQSPDRLGVTDTDLNNFFLVADAMLAPYATTQNPASGGPLRAAITEVYIDPNTGAARAQWSKANSAGTARAIGSPVDIPSNLIGKDPITGKVLPNQYFILSEASYMYAPSILPDAASWLLQESTFTRPRNTTTYACVPYNGQTACPTS